MTNEEGYSERRLREAVDGILSAGAVPFSERADLGEEIAGHLRERMQAHVDAGLGLNAATERAIEEFCAPATIGRDLRATYHSRLWVSTIGVLLPVPASADAMPGVVLWAARGGRFIAIVSVLLGGYAALTMSPVRALAVGSSLCVGGVVIWIAAEALRRGQSWGWTALTWVMAVETVAFFVSFQTPTGVNLSINGLVGFLLSMRLLANGSILRSWVLGSGTLPRRLAVAVAGVLLAWAVLPYVGDKVPDPTQASEGDILAVASLECGLAEGSDPPMGRVTVTTDLTWAKVDLLPLGLARAGQDWGDSLSIRFSDNRWLAGGVTLRDGNGDWLDQSGNFGLTLPPTWRYEDLSGGVDASAMTAGRPVSLVAEAYGGPSVTESSEDAPATVEPIDYPQFVDIRYAHLDRFVLRMHVACGEQKRLIPEQAFRQSDISP